MNWQKLYRILAKELPRHRGSHSAMYELVVEYGKTCGITLDRNQVNDLITKFAPKRK